MSFYEASNYRDLLKAKIAEQAATRGYKSMLARAAGCQSSHLSQVLRGVLHLTPDQAMAICDFWALDVYQTDFFLALVNYERASSAKLRAKLAQDMERSRAAGHRVSLKTVEAVGTKSNLSFDDAVTYWSTWHFPAIHGCLFLPQLDNPESIGERLALHSGVVGEVLEKLRLMGLAELKKGRWLSTAATLYEHENKSLVKAFHGEMRLLANKDMHYGARRDPSDLHYTFIETLARDDMMKLKALLFEAVKDIQRLAKDSPREELVCVCLDYFRI